jgi:hypothetical protein
MYLWRFVGHPIRAPWGALGKRSCAGKVMLAGHGGKRAGGLTAIIR